MRIYYGVASVIDVMVWKVVLRMKSSFDVDDLSLRRGVPLTVCY